MKPPVISIVYFHTTGPRVGTDKIFHFGVLKIVPEKPVEYMEWLCDPVCIIPRSARLRSGVKPQDVTGRPTFSQIKPELQQFLTGAEFLLVPANANQMEWLSALDMDLPPAEKILDVLLLAQYFLPDIESLDFPELHSRWVGKPLPTQTLSGILTLSLKILTAIVHMQRVDPRPFYRVLPALLERTRIPELGFMRQFIRHVTDYHIPEINDLFGSAALEAGQIHKLLDDPKMILKPLWGVSEKTDALQATTRDALEPKRRRVKPVSEKRISELLSAKGVGSNIANYKSRPGQNQYALLVNAGLTKQDITFLEAGTGTGKTLGYLIPAMAFLEQNHHEKVIISTATKNLQNQIMEREYPRVKKHFNNVRAALIKGKSNYPCLTALEKYYRYWMAEQAEPVAEIPGAIAAWIYLVNHIHLTQNGDLETIPSRMFRVIPQLSELITDVNAATHCTDKNCDPGADIYGQIKANALAANLIITNHYKLPTLPEDLDGLSRTIIVDEADRFEDGMRGALATTLSAGDLLRFLNRLSGTGNQQGFLQLLRTQTSGVPGDHPVLLHVESLIKTEQTLRFQISGLFGTFSKMVSKNAYWTSGRREPEGEILVEKLRELADGSFLQEALRQMKALYTKLIQALNVLANSAAINSRLRERCSVYATIASQHQELLGSVLSGLGSADTAHALKIRPEPVWELSRIPVNLGGYIRELIYTPDRKVIYTSATLAVGDDFAFLRGAFGVSKGTGNNRVSCKQVPAILDYERQARVIVDTSIRPFIYHDREAKAAWERDIIRAVTLYGLAANGRTLVLFTSNQDMLRVHDRIRGIFQALDIEVMLQNGSSHEQIEAFRRNEFSILLGVDRFWTGVDFPGPTLSQVIIVRAPNPGLSNPVIQHRKLHDKHFLKYKYGLMSLMKLRQGIGRLLRNEADLGGVIILDSRYATTPWMQAQIEKLPFGVEFLADQKRIMERVIVKCGLKDEFQSRGLDLFDILDKNFLPERKTGGERRRGVPAENRFFRETYGRPYAGKVRR